MNFTIAAFVLLTPALWAQSYTISTVAGGALPPFAAPATSISIGPSAGVVSDSAGNLYVADPDLNVVFQLTPGGAITIFAGTGTAGYSGDGGPATDADLDYPLGLAFDQSGNLLIADTDNNVVRKVSSTGTITTLAGTGISGYTGDGGPAIQAALSDPEGLALDGNGNVYIADTYNKVVRIVSAVGTINTYAGNHFAGYSGDGGPSTAASLSFPIGLAVDAGGNLYIADANNSVVRIVSSGSTISTFAGNGLSGYSGDGASAISAQLNDPEGVASDASGNVYIADSGNSVIRKVLVDGTITTIAGNGSLGYLGDGGPATSAELNYPESVMVGTGGTVYICDSDNNRVREISTLGVITTIAGNGSGNYGGDGGAPLAALLATPGDVAVAANGTLYIADAGNNRIRQVVPGGVITTLAGTGSYGYSGDNGQATAAQLNYPSGVAVNADGDVFVADTYNSVVREISATGIITTVAGTGAFGYSGDGGPATEATLSFPQAVVIDTAGNLFIADTYNNSVRKVTAAGVITTVAGNGAPGYSGDSGPAVAAQLNNPNGLAVDTIGNLYVADTENNVVREVSTAGVISTVAATIGQLSLPYGVAVDGSGNLFIADASNNRIKKVSSSGILSTVAGASFGYSGDGGPATSANLNFPEGLVLLPGGVIYVADSYNNVIRALTPCIQTLAATANADSTAQTLSIPLTAASSCIWSASSLPSWITSASSGTGSGNLALTLQANTTGSDRGAVITVNGLPLTVAQNFTATTFSDVLPGTYYFDAVNLLNNKNITAGCGSDDYCPGETVTRDDMAIFIVRTILGDGPFTYSPAPYFADVPSTYFAFPWIQKLYELGITAGCGGTPINYCPSTTVTRDQMGIFIIRARYGPATMFTSSPTPYFTDVPSTYYAFDWIQRMYQDTITAGCSSVPLEYCPTDPVTRGDMAIFLMRGGYNQLVPPTAPVITSISPSTLTHGMSGSFTITGANTTFQQGATNLVFSASSGIAVNSLTVISATTMQVTLTASSSAPLEPVSIYEQTEPQEAVLPNGLLIQ